LEQLTVIELVWKMVGWMAYERVAWRVVLKVYDWAALWGLLKGK